MFSVNQFAALGADKPLDPKTEICKQMHWRSIGPAVMGGRIADIAVDEKTPYTIYLALATGGLLKSVNDGCTWTPIFDHQTVASVGAVAVAPSDPKVVWVGTGEANGRNSSSWGDGVYKSTDGGATWKSMGLKETREIGRIAIDPKDANVVYVAAAGHLWGANKERGLYKTTDGGKTWKQVLAIDADAGVIDAALGPVGSHIVYAAAYARRRSAWGFTGLSDKAGVYKSGDDGKTWKRCVNGLPTAAVGRIGLCVSRSKPAVIYAVIECAAGGAGGLSDDHSRHGGVFRSDDAGETWKRASGTVPRGFYFGQIRIDPTDTERIYVLGFGLSISEDGGKTFKSPGYNMPGVHPDEHAMWIDPLHPEHILLGTDGGLYVTHDRTKTWEALNNFPMGEFYEVNTDARSPYWVYGGLQDNSCWMGPSATRRNQGPVNSDWVDVGGGDGFYTLSDPQDPNIIYSESQGGGVVRIDRHTNKRRYLHPTAPEGTPDYRFNWNTPLLLSTFDHDALYVGGNQLFKFTQKGVEWEAISPDLSRKMGERITASGSGAETYGTIVSLAESPLKRGVLWAGTDDGCVQITQDEGKTWTNVTNNLPGHLRDGWIKRIEASRFSPGRAYLAVDRHRNDDLAPYLFATEDYGKSWRSIAGDLPREGSVLALREDPINPDLLFVGTEFGAFTTLDRGAHWRKLGEDLPTVAVQDLAIQTRDHALIAATHGRSLYVLDSIAPLEALKSGLKQTDVILFPIAPVEEYLIDYTEANGQHEFIAQNPERGAVVAYWLQSLAAAAPRVEITDDKKKKIATLTGERFPGMARLVWDLYQPAEEGASRRQSRRFVKPGVYTATLIVGKTKLTETITVSGLPALSEKEPEEDEFTEQRKTEKDDMKDEIGK